MKIIQSYQLVLQLAVAVEKQRRTLGIGEVFNRRFGLLKSD